jgi:hypothetical protein
MRRCTRWARARGHGHDRTAATSGAETHGPPPIFIPPMCEPSSACRPCCSFPPRQGPWTGLGRAWLQPSSAPTSSRSYSYRSLETSYPPSASMAAHSAREYERLCAGLTNRSARSQSRQARKSSHQSVMMALPPGTRTRPISRRALCRVTRHELYLGRQPRQGLLEHGGNQVKADKARC